MFRLCCSDFENSSVLPEQLGDHFYIKCELQFKVEKPLKLEKISIHDYGPYAKKGKEGKVRTARKGWRRKSLL